MIAYEDFAIRHKGMLESIEGKEVFEFLTKTENINKMIVFSDLQMPALSGVAKILEGQFKDNSEFALDNPRSRRIIGRMITDILKDFGYVPLKSKNRVRKFAESKYFKSATVYAVDSSIEPKYKIEITNIRNV